MELFEKTLDSKKIFDGRVLHIVLDEVELPDGKRSKREVVNHPGGVCVAALDEDNNLSFVKQFRYPDKEVVRAVKEGLKRTGGYCPCRLERTEDNKCMCKEFREQIADPEFEGFCHCMLYYKSRKKG